MNTAKLAASQVIEIRKRFADGGVSPKELAAEYGVAKDTIRSIVNRKTWRHLP